MPTFSEAVGVIVTFADDWTTEHVLRAKAWRNSHRDGKEKELIPDGLFSALSRDKTCAIAVELELNAKNKRRYEAILEAYRVKRTLWAVWYIVESETLGRTLQDVWRRLNRGARNDMLIWSLLDELLANPWEVTIRSANFSFRLRDVLKMKEPAPWGAPTGSGRPQAPAGQVVALVAQS
ncbi:MAG: hypothetical protein IT285_03440 [Bdellovibrionales bacterium]|nr:hypothetical protein [Bdellovibrionales bacterium]